MLFRSREKQRKQEELRLKGEGLQRLLALGMVVLISRLLIMSSQIPLNFLSNEKCIKMIGDCQ
jgi:hypothetical protein